MKTPITRTLLLIGIVASALLAGCDSPTDPAAGLLSGVVIQDANGNQVARFVDNGSVSGQLNVAPGATRTFRVRLLTSSGQILSIDGFEYSIRNPGVVIGFKANVGAQLDQLRVEGLQPGSAGTVHFQIFHFQDELFQVEGIPLEIG